MGAAGPIAGFIVTALCIFYDAPNTQNHQAVEVQGSVEQYIEEVQSIPPAEGIWATINDWMGFQPPSVEEFDVLIMADPLLMKLGHSLVLDVSLSPFANLGPIAFAGWVGCLITSINLLPIGQLDGGHILNALFPHRARESIERDVGCCICVWSFHMERLDGVVDFVMVHGSSSTGLGPTELRFVRTSTWHCNHCDRLYLLCVRCLNRSIQRRFRLPISFG